MSDTLSGNLPPAAPEAASAPESSPAEAPVKAAPVESPPVTETGGSLLKVAGARFPALARVIVKIKIGAIERTPSVAPAETA